MAAWQYLRRQVARRSPCRYRNVLPKSYDLPASSSKSHGAYVSVGIDCGKLVRLQNVASSPEFDPGSRVGRSRCLSRRGQWIPALQIF